MMKEKRMTDTPAVGCMIGTAYQKLLSQLSSALKDAGLDVSTGEYLVLRALYHGDGIQQCEIADMVGKDKAAICRCVAGLERKGLVRTESVSHKCLRVFVSEKGLDIKPAIIEVARKRHQALADITTSGELETFIKVLENILKS